MTTVDREQFYHAVFKESFVSNETFMEEVNDLASKLLHTELFLARDYFKVRTADKKIEELKKYSEEDDFALDTYAEGADTIKNISTHLYALFHEIHFKVMGGVFCSILRIPQSLSKDWGVSADDIKHLSEQHEEMEIEQQTKHQSKSLQSNTTGSLGSKIPPSVPRDDQHSHKKDKSKKDLDKGATSSSKSHEGGSSKSGSDDSNKNKNKNKQPRNRIEKVITGHMSIHKEKVKDIMIYDIPASWTIHQILTHLKNWGSVIQLSSKRQRKYQTIKIRIELLDDGLDAYQRGEWTVSLGGTPVRWFPGTYSLKERKHRERFVAVIKNLLEDMITDTLYSGTPHQFLLNAKVDSFKIIKLADGSRKLLGYYKNLDDMKTVIGNKQFWGEISLEWCALNSLAPKRKERPQPNHSAPEKSRD